MPSSLDAFRFLLQGKGGSAAQDYEMGSQWEGRTCPLLVNRVVEGADEVLLARLADIASGGTA